jgi:hypothetical protein
MVREMEVQRLRVTCDDARCPSSKLYDKVYEMASWSASTHIRPAASPLSESPIGPTTPSVLGHLTKVEVSLLVCKEPRLPFFQNGKLRCVSQLGWKVLSPAESHTFLLTVLRHPVCITYDPLPGTGRVCAELRIRKATVDTHTVEMIRLMSKAAS